MSRGARGRTRAVPAAAPGVSSCRAARTCSWCGAERARRGRVRRRCPRARRDAGRATATRTVLPRLTRPVVGARCRRSGRAGSTCRRRCAPRMPVRSPGAIRHSTSRSTGRSPKETQTSSRSTTSLPSRAVASDGSSTLSRSCGTSAISCVGRVDAELRLRRARGGTPAQPRQLLADQVLPLGLDDGGLPVPLHPLQDVRGVPALERLDDPVMDLPGRGAHLVEEPAVVGDDQQPPGVCGPAALQVRGEPGDRPRRPGGWSARPARGRRRRRRAAGPGQRGGAARRESVPSRACQSRSPRARRSRRGRAGPPPTRVRAFADDGVTHGGLVVEGVGLVEHADPDAAAHGHPARIGLTAARRASSSRRTCRRRCDPRCRSGRPRSRRA